MAKAPPAMSELVEVRPTSTATHTMMQVPKQKAEFEKCKRCKQDLTRDVSQCDCCGQTRPSQWRPCQEAKCPPQRNMAFVCNFDTMECPQCDFMVPILDYCNNCGQDLRLRQCLKCDFMVPNLDYCNNCGQDWNLYGPGLTLDQLDLLSLPQGDPLYAQREALRRLREGFSTIRSKISR